MAVWFNLCTPLKMNPSIYLFLNTGSVFLTCVLTHMKYISLAAAFLIYIPSCDF